MKRIFTILGVVVILIVGTAAAVKRPDLTLKGDGNPTPTCGPTGCHGGGK